MTKINLESSNLEENNDMTKINLESSNIKKIVIDNNNIVKKYVKDNKKNFSFFN